MLQTNDVGNLFQKMLAAYGNRWTQPVDAMSDWQRVLRDHSADEIMGAAERAVKAYPDFPPTQGQFLGLLQGATTSLNADLVKAESIYAYTRPESKANPKGNDQHTTLPESIAARRPGENVETYRRRIVDAMVFARFSKLGPDGRSIGPYT